MKARKAVAQPTQEAPAEHPAMAKLDTERQSEARRLGLDFNLLSTAEVKAFAANGAAGLAEYQRSLWAEEAAKRPPQPGLMA